MIEEGKKGNAKRVRRAPARGPLSSGSWKKPCHTQEGIDSESYFGASEISKLRSNPLSTFRNACSGADDEEKNANIIPLGTHLSARAASLAEAGFIHKRLPAFLTGV